MISPNSTKNQTQKVPSFFLSNNYRYKKTQHTNSTKNLNISLGSQESSHRIYVNAMQNNSLLDFGHKKQQINYKFMERSYQYGSQNDVNKKLASIATQNSQLKEENEFLRRQLEKIRKNPQERVRIQSSIQKYKQSFPSKSQSPSHRSGDLRNTIKKQSSLTKQQETDAKEMKVKFQILTKQCKMYEEIIDKMEGTIRRLTDENKQLHNNNKNLPRNFEKDSNSNRKQQLESLKEKVNLVMKQYSQLQSKMHSNELEWVIWKEQWITEKNIYLNKIKQLQNKLKEKQNIQKKF